MTFQFIANPTGDGMSDADFLSSALEQPMSLASTLWDQAKGGAVESFGLGTLVRDAQLPTLLRGPELTFESDALNQAAQEQYAGKITESQYKASPDYREGVPWQEGMTRDRAAALADQYDRGKVREFYASKRPVTAFMGKLAGSATDPINYIPVFGEAVTAANVARFGKIGGKAITSALDASANTAIASVASAPIREQLGDDVSFQSTVSQIAMAAMVGGAFGAIHGRFGRAAPDELRADAETKLATLENVQKSRVALNDAIDGLLHDGEVNLSPASAGFVSRMADEELPKVSIERMSRETDPEAFSRLETLDTTFGINDAEIRRLQSLTLDNERFGPTRKAMIEADQLNARLQKAEEQVEKANSAKAKAQAIARRDDIRQQLREKVRGIDDATVKEIEDVDARLASRRQANEPVAAERDALRQRVETIRAQARDQYWAEQSQAKRRVSSGPSLAEPPIPNGVIRVYHSGSIGEGETGRWVSTNRTYASNYRGDLPLYYLDLPKTDPRVNNPDIPEQGVRQGFTFNFETTPGEATRLRQISRSKEPNAGRSRVVDSSSPIPIADPSVSEAEKRVGKPEASRDLADQYRVNPETGDFPEMGELEQLRAEGRLTDEDVAALDEADETMKTASGYAEALKAFANCVI